MVDYTVSAADVSFVTLQKVVKSDTITKYIPVHGDYFPHSNKHCTRFREMIIIDFEFILFYVYFSVIVLYFV